MSNRVSKDHSGKKILREVFHLILSDNGLIYKGANYSSENWEDPIKEKNISLPIGGTYIPMNAVAHLLNKLGIDPSQLDMYDPKIYN